MFVLSELSDTIPVAPNVFGIDQSLVIKDAINRKYANRLIAQVGLGLALYDLLTCAEGKIRWGDGLVWYKVTFRLVVFSPHIGEVIVGNVHSSTPSHIRISVGFFDDIYIPKDLLPSPADYDFERKEHFWAPTDEDDPVEPLDTPEEGRLYLSTNDTVRFRIISLDWQEVEPLAPSIRDKPPPIDPVTKEFIVPTEEEEEVKRRERERDAGLRVVASAQEQGLGLVEWWEAT